MPPTREEQVREILRCGKDPIYFINTYCRIVTLEHGLVPFKTFPFQDECIRSFEDNRFNIVLKSRQLGLSTISAAYAVWLAIFYKDKNVLVIATKLPTAINFIKKVATILQNVPKWLLMTTFEPTKQAISFSNGSQVKAIPTSEDAGRSEALSLLIVDEAAWIRDFDDIWTGLSPTMSTGGRAIIISTPNGVGGQYYRLWTEAEAGLNDFNPIRLPWQVHPEHDEEWFKKETHSLTKRKVAQEFLCDFITSGDTFLQPVDIESLKALITVPVEKLGHDRNVWVWAHPVPGRTYVISADVSRGDARDYSAFHIIDTADCEVAVEYMGKVPPEKLADMLEEWGKKYYNALVVPENNTFGYGTCIRLRDKGYPKLYYHTHRGDPFTYIPQDPNELPGFPTNPKTRTQILTKLEELIRNKQLKIYSQRLYDQLQAFIWNGNKPQASKDSYDDLIISLAIGCWLVEGGSGVSEQAMAMAMAILKSSVVTRRDIHQMPGGIDEAQPLVNPNIRGVNAHNVYRPIAHSQSRNADMSDFGWLLK